MRKLATFLVAATIAAAQQSGARDVDATLTKAWAEMRDFEKAGGKRADNNHPVEKWVQTLWALYRESPGTPEANKAAAQAVHLLIHADRFQEAYDRAERVPADDPAWEQIPEILVEAGSLQHDFTYLFRKLPAILSSSTNPLVRAAIKWNLGRVWQGQKQDEKAKAAYKAAVELAPDSASGKQAERQLYELLHLGPGQLAPAFSATPLEGSRISLAEYRGRPVVLVFWAST
jgi:tetratricopeptide (TPR) repeat protein